MKSITVNDLRTKMNEFADNLVDYNSFSIPYMKAESYKHFGDRIVNTELNGKPNIVTFRSPASQILYDYHQKGQLSEDEQKTHYRNSSKIDNE